MKITQKKEFNPITIVLETEEEAEILKTIAGSTICTSSIFCHKLYNELDILNIKMKQFTGKIEIL